MDKVISMHDVVFKNQLKSQGSLVMKELHLSAIGQLHITFKDRDGNLIDLDLDPIAPPTITPANVED